MLPNSSNTVLLVDDNEQNRYACSKYLKKAGFEIWEAATGADALKLARNNPCVIVLDVRLPDISGFDVCARIKSDPITSSIPVLHTSAAFVQTGDRVRGLEGGADNYLTSPVQPEELVASVRALLRTRLAEATANNLAAQWETTFDAISDGICMVTTSGKIERCNRAFATLLNKSFHELVGQSFKSLGGSKLLDDLAVLPVIKSRKKEVSETQVEQLWLRITADPVWSKANELVGAVYVIADITERKVAEIGLASATLKIKSHAREMEEKVAERTAELQRTVKSLDTFCYTIAHDLKSPLRSIKGFTAILREEYADKLDDAGRDYAKRIVDSVERMHGLIDALLEYGRLSNMELPLEEIDLGEELDFILNELWADAKAREAEIIIRKPLPKFRSNSTVIRQVLGNLMSNGIKFVSPQVRPKVEVSAEVVGDRVRISVKDNGIGIDPSCHTRIFEVFERLHGKESYPGTGIGLAIVRKGVERLGGKVGVDSRPGEGSRFWVEIPYAN